jgi:MFS family permease
MLLCEVLPRNSRGLGMYCYNIALSLGFLMSGLLNMLLHDPTWGWRVSVALLAAPGVVLAALLPGISESPQVLLQQGKDESAVQVRDSKEHVYDGVQQVQLDNLLLRDPEHGSI